jgi:protein SCO1/2
MYLMDPNGEFVEAFGQATTTAEVVDRVQKEVERGHGNKS